jgi:uncharacterized membrane protein
MIEIEHNVVINRPIEDVYAFMANPENTPLWAVAVKETKLTFEGPIGVGTTYNQVLEFLGRRIESNYKFTEYEPNNKYSNKTTSGLCRKRKARR